MLNIDKHCKWCVTMLRITYNTYKESWFISYSLYTLQNSKQKRTISQTDSKKAQAKAQPSYYSSKAAQYMASSRKRKQPSLNSYLLSDTIKNLCVPPRGVSFFAFNQTIRCYLALAWLCHHHHWKTFGKCNIFLWLSEMFCFSTFRAKSSALKLQLWSWMAQHWCWVKLWCSSSYFEPKGNKKFWTDWFTSIRDVHCLPQKCLALGRCWLYAAALCGC